MKSKKELKKEAYQNYQKALEFALLLPMDSPQDVWNAARKEILRTEKIYFGA